jgi:hypothetical protein
VSLPELGETISFNTSLHFFLQNLQNLSFQNKNDKNDFKRFQTFSNVFVRKILIKMIKRTKNLSKSFYFNSIINFKIVNQIFFIDTVNPYYHKFVLEKLRQKYTLYTEIYSI